MMITDVKKNWVTFVYIFIAEYELPLITAAIPSNLTKIREYAFADCINLTKVSIPTNDSLKTIGS